MNTDDLLIDLFALQAEDRPEATAVLDAVHDRIAGQHRVAITRAATVLGAAAAVAALAVGISVATEPSGHSSGPAGAPPSPTRPTPKSSAPAHVRSAPPTPGRTAPASAVPTGKSGPPTPSTTAPGSRYDYLTIGTAWLPGPAKQDRETSYNNGKNDEQRDWTVRVDGTDLDVVIWTEAGPVQPRMQAAGGGPYRSITVEGHPARELVGAHCTIIAVDLGNGTVAYVGPSADHLTAKVTTARITAIAEKLAQNLELNRHDLIPGR